MATAMRRQKALAVLAYLAVARPRGPHRRDKIASLFWPELSGDRARAALRVTLSRLRDEVGHQVIATTPGDDLMVRPGALSCDVLQLEDALAAGDVHRINRLYRGHFMDGVHVEGAGNDLEEWLSLERRRLRDAVFLALANGASRYAAEGAASEAMKLAQRAIEIAPAAEGVAASAELEELIDRLRQSTLDTVAPMARPIEPPARRARSRLAWMTGGVVAALLLFSGMVMFRGSTSSPPSRWRFVGVPGTAPAGRIEGGAAFDAKGRVLLFGGQLYMPDSSSPLNDLWRLGGFGEGREPFWTRVMPRGPAPRPRWLFGMASDTAHDRLIVHGGAFGSTAPCGSDTWVLDSASHSVPSWRRVMIRGRGMPARAGFNAYFDASSRRLIVFAGHDCVSTFFNETWVLSFDDSTLASGAWTLLRPDTSDGAPRPRSSYAAAYDGEHHRLFLYGGARGRPYPGLWVLENADAVAGGSRWRPLECAGSAPARHAASGAFDPSRGTWFIFGGIDSLTTYSRDLWRVTGLRGNLIGCRWERIEQGEPAPSARAHGSLLLEPRTRDLILVGGAFTSMGLADVWVLRLP